MNEKPLESAHDDDIRLSERALRRAAFRARELAARTGTALIISHNGVIEQITPKPEEVAQGVAELPPLFRHARTHLGDGATPCRARTHEFSEDELHSEGP